MTRQEREGLLNGWSMQSSFSGRKNYMITLFSSVQSLSRVQLFATPWTAACQASLFITNSRSLPKLMSIDAIQPSHSLLSPSPPALNLSQHQGLFKWVRSLHQVAKLLGLPLQPQSFQWIFRVDHLQDWLVWSPCCPRDSQESSPASQFESINSSALSLFYGTVLTSMPDDWENHRFDYRDFCWQSDVSVF